MEFKHSGGSRRRSVELLTAAVLSVAVVVSGLAVAEAKAPMPVLGVPDGPITVGESVVVPVSTAWPAGLEDAAALDPDYWGDALVWTFVARPADASMSEAVVLPWRHVGPSRYELDFTPATTGAWIISYGTPDPAGVMQSFDERAYDVRARPTTGSTFGWFLIGGAALAVAIGWWFVIRSGRRRVNGDDRASRELVH